MTTENETKAGYVHRVSRRTLSMKASFAAAKVCRQLPGGRKRGDHQEQCFAFSSQHDIARPK